MIRVFRAIGVIRSITLHILCSLRVIRISKVIKSIRVSRLIKAVKINRVISVIRVITIIRVIRVIKQHTFAPHFLLRST